ncbi:hypothetical protein [Comamonas thiooxydans]|uniref:hypothetical protein n=1 Tax=Comamonas thiooxydans TaxID=363952 RepID=UPI000AA001E2|nr:hypothetical protein [Comamonas thiooxydans]
MAAEWGWNPEAVGAIGTAASALLAAGVAVWVGVVAPKKMSHEVQRRQLLMIGPRLRGELSAMQFRLGLFLATWKPEGDYPRSGYADIATALQCPVLSESLASGTLFPEAETRLMTKVQEESQLLASLLLTESKLKSSIPGSMLNYEKRVKELMRVVTELLEVLNALAGIKRESFIPAARSGS